MIKHGRTPFLSISIRTICSDLMANLAMTFILGTARNDVTRQNRHHATTPAHFAPKIRTAPTRDRVTIQNRHRATPAQFATKLGLRHNGRSRYDPKWPPQFVIATFGSFDYQRVSIWLPLWVCECAIWAFHCTIMALSPLCKICGMGLFDGKNERTWCIMMGNIKHLIILLILITDFRTFPALSQLSPNRHTNHHKPMALVSERTWSWNPWPWHITRVRHFPHLSTTHAVHAVLFMFSYVQFMDFSYFVRKATHLNHLNWCWSNERVENLLNHANTCLSTKHPWMSPLSISIKIYQSKVVVVKQLVALEFQWTDQSFEAFWSYDGRFTLRFSRPGRDRSAQALADTWAASKETCIL